jgi:hypothetical protein
LNIANSAHDGGGPGDDDAGTMPIFPSASPLLMALTPDQILTTPRRIKT